MAMIDVLSGQFAGTLKAEADKVYGKETASGTADALAQQFALLLGGLLFPGTGLKGQDSGDGNGQNLTGSAQNLQSSFPAGKEANSGLGKNLQGVPLGILELIATGNAHIFTGGARPTLLVNQNGVGIAEGVAKANSQGEPDTFMGLGQAYGQTWMAPGPTGNKIPLNTELDQYKDQVIELLGELRGQIKFPLSQFPVGLGAVLRQSLGLNNGVEAGTQGIVTVPDEQVAGLNQTAVTLNQANQDQAGLISGLGTNNELSAKNSETGHEINESRELAIPDARIKDKTLGVVSKQVGSDLLSYRPVWRGEQQTLPGKTTQSFVPGEQSVATDQAVPTVQNTTSENPKGLAGKMNPPAGSTPNNDQQAKSFPGSSIAQNEGLIQSTGSVQSPGFKQSMGFTFSDKIDISGTGEEKMTSKAGVPAHSNLDLGGQTAGSAGAFVNKEAVLLPPNPSDAKGTGVSPWVQVAGTVREYLKTARPEVKELEIQLHPVELGKISIELRWDGDKVNLHLQASEAMTGNILQNHLPDLRRSLQEMGIACGILQMGFGGDGRQGMSQNQHQGTNFQHVQADEESAGPVPEVFAQDQGEYQINVTA